MLERWGLTTMKPFDQASVKKKERFPIEDIEVQAPAQTPSVSTVTSAVAASIGTA